jgi:hypothetical protein
MIIANWWEFQQTMDAVVIHLTKSCATEFHKLLVVLPSSNIIIVHLFLWNLVKLLSVLQ